MKYMLLFVLSVSALRGYTQVSYPISSYQSTPEAYRFLLLTNQQIENNDTINEEIIDLTSPMVTDSIVDRKKEHHQVFLVGWIIHAFGDYNWRTMTMNKQKFVGTVRGDSRSGGEEFTEYDINFNLYCHLHKYLWHVFEAYDRQAKIHRKDFVSTYLRHHKNNRNYTGEPFVRDTTHIDIYRYRLHCELTPQREYRPMLNYLFYPTMPGINIDKHANFGTSFPSMGFYGVHCLDCNHTCHPEIHPYEWLWWMNLHNGTVRDKTWLIGMMKDGSNRFHHWSHNPKTGEINIPFAYEVKDRAAKDRLITIDHLVFGPFIDSNLNKLNLPATLIDPNHSTIEVSLTDDKGGSIPVTIRFEHPMATEGIKYWFSGVNWDEQNHILSGNFNMAASVKDIYTAKITFSGQ